MKETFKWRDEAGKLTPFARGVRTFLQSFIPVFLALAGFDAITSAGQVSIDLLYKGLIAGTGAGVAGVAAFVMNQLGDEE